MNARRLALFLFLVGSTFGLAQPALARLEVAVFAHVPAPGYPANAVVGADGRVYVGTFKSFSSPSDTGPSKVFAFSSAGRLLRTYTVQGQTRGAADAVQVATVDRSGALYLLDQDPPRVIKLDPRTGAQSTWATFKSLPACPASGPCSDGSGGNPPEPDFAAWGPDGSLYVTDYNQALIWRVPRGGGAASEWLTDARFNGIIVGVAGIQLMSDGHTLMLSTGGGGDNVSTGKLYTLPIKADGSPGQLHQLWESAPTEAPDGLALSRTGNVYIALVGPAGNAVVEVSPQGKEIARVPASPVANQMLDVPFDAPGSVTFLGDSVLVTNQSAIQNTSSHWAVLKVAVGERGLPPSLPPAVPAYGLAVSPAHPVAGNATRFRFSATLGSRPVSGAMVSFAGHRAKTDRSGRVAITVVLHRHIRPYRAALLVAGRQVASAAVLPVVLRH